MTQKTIFEWIDEKNSVHKSPETGERGAVHTMTSKKPQPVTGRDNINNGLGAMPGAAVTVTVSPELHRANRDKLLR